MQIIKSTRLSKWCKENRAAAESQADAISIKGFRGRSPAATLQDLLHVVQKAERLGTDIIYGVGAGKNQQYFFFAGSENDVLNKVGI